MELTKKDKEQLLKWGYLEEDFAQIQRAIDNGKIESFSRTDHWKPISVETALKMIGRTEFLSGISRAAFHTSAVAIRFINLTFNSLWTNMNLQEQSSMMTMYLMLLLICTAVGKTSVCMKTSTSMASLFVNVSAKSGM